MCWSRNRKRRGGVSDSMNSGALVSSLNVNDEIETKEKQIEGGERMRDKQEKQRCRIDKRDIDGVRSEKMHSNLQRMLHATKEGRE